MYGSQGYKKIVHQCGTIPRQAQTTDRAHGLSTNRPAYDAENGINQAIEAMGLPNTQRIATLLDGITRHSPEGLNFKKYADDVDWKQAVGERDRGLYDWTDDRPINSRI